MQSNISPDNVAYVLRTARNLQAAIGGVELETAEAWLAEMLGYDDSFQLYLASDNTGLSTSSQFARNSVEPRETSAGFQAETLAARAGIPLDQAAGLVLTLAEEMFDEATVRDGILWTDVLRFHLDGDLDQAMAVTIEAFKRHPESPLSDAGRLVISVALLKARNHPGLAELLNTAADRGAPEHAYNWATYLLETATTRAHVALACTYFQRAISLSRSPRIRAASLMNYATIFRDGRLTGTPDLVRALEIAEEAARMGLVLAMFSAASICSTLANSGDASYVGRAAYCFHFAVDYVDAGKIVLDSNGEAQLKETVDKCRLGLAHMHVHGMFVGADEEAAIKLVEELANAGNEDARGYRELGIKKRIARAEAGGA